MKNSTLLVLFLSFSVLQWGCGRDGLYSQQCTTELECKAGEQCAGGECVAKATTNNNGPSACTVDTDCKEDEKCSDSICIAKGCFERDKVCIFVPVCDEEVCPAMICEFKCKEGQVKEGCNCVDQKCSVNSECSDQLCIDGKCQDCTEDNQCPGSREVCSDGQCVEDNRCRTNADCASNKQCAKDGVCINRPECLLDKDCDDDELCVGGRCTFAPECKSNTDCPEGFECVGDQCFEKLCRGPKDCPDSQICDAGQCVDPKLTVACFVGTSDQIIVEGQVIEMEAFAFDSDGSPIFAEFIWTSSKPSSASVTGSSVTGGRARGVVVMTAQARLPNGKKVDCTDSTTLRNPGLVDPNGLRIIVSDIESSQALANVLVTIDGQVIGRTDGGGVINWSRPPGEFDVSAFANNKDYITIKNVNSNIIRIPMKSQSGTADAAGFKGSFDLSNVHSSGTIDLGLAGASLRGGLLDVNLGGLLGDTFLTNADIPGFGNFDLPLPGGLTLGGGPFQIKNQYFVKTTGGSRFAWGLGGRLPFIELLQLFQSGDLNGTNILATLLPLFSRFDHAAIPRVFTALPLEVDSSDLDGDGDTNELLPNYPAFPVIQLAPSVPQTLASDVGVSNFPRLSDGPAQIAVVVGGTLTPETGLVPLGISAIQDADGDGRPDTQRLTIAPNHGSLVGTRYSVIAIAFNGAGTGGQFALPDEFSVALWNGQTFQTSTALGTFPDASRVRIRRRKIDFQSDAGPLYRVRIVGANRSWEVWDYGASAAGGFVHSLKIPNVPNGVQDLWTNSQVFVDAIQTNTSLTDIVGATGVGLENAGIVSSAFNRTRAR